MASGFIETWYVRLPVGLRRMPLLFAAATDGLYVTAWPLVARILPFAALLFGLSAGALHWGGLNIWDKHVEPVPAAAFMQMIPLLVAAVVLGGLGAQFGLLLVLGYAAGDLVFGGPHFIGHFERHDLPWLLLHVYVPLLTSYALFLLLAVQPSLMARLLATSVRRLAASRALLARLTVTALIAALQGLFVYAWILSAPMVIRPLWMWSTHRFPPTTVFYYADVLVPWLPLLAVAVACLRAGLMAWAMRSAGAKQQVAALILALRSAPAGGRPVPRAVKILIASLLTTLLMAGFYKSLWPVGIVMFALITAVMLVRVLIPSVLPGWRAWCGMMAGIPLLLRWVAMIGGAYGLAGLVLSVPGQAVRDNDAAGAFGAQLATFLLGMLLATVIFPSDGQGPSRRTRPQPLPPMLLKTAALGLCLLILLNASPALAICADPQCCYSSEFVAKIGIAALIGALLLIFAPEVLLYATEGFLEGLKMGNEVKEAVDVLQKWLDGDGHTQSAHPAQGGGTVMPATGAPVTPGNPGSGPQVGAGDPAAPGADGSPSSGHSPDGPPTAAAPIINGGMQSSAGTAPVVGSSGSGAPAAPGSISVIINQAGASQGHAATGGSHIFEVPMPGSHDATLAALDAAALAGQPVKFDLTGLTDIPGALAGTGPDAGSLQGIALRHIRTNWTLFESVTHFYQAGQEVSAPWMM